MIFSSIIYRLMPETSGSPEIPAEGYEIQYAELHIFFTRIQREIAFFPLSSNQNLNLFFRFQMHDIFSQKPFLS